MEGGMQIALPGSDGRGDRDQLSTDYGGKACVAGAPNKISCVAAVFRIATDRERSRGIAAGTIRAHARLRSCRDPQTALSQLHRRFA